MAQQGLEEAGAAFRPAAVAASAAEPPPGPARRLGAVLARLPGWLDALRGFLLSAAVFLVVALVAAAILREVGHQGIVVERLEVPRGLEERGLKGEVLASQLVDAIVRATRAAHFRAERPSLAMGWRTGDFQVPTLGLSMTTIVRMVEELVGRVDTRIAGEIVGVEGGYRLRLRLVPPRPSQGPIEVPLPAAAPPEQLAAALDEAVRRILPAVDPLPLAIDLLVEGLERPAAGLAPERTWGALQEVADAVAHCLAVCEPADRIAAYGTWGEALRRAAARLDDADTARTLREEAVDKFALARELGRPSVEVLLREADTLFELDPARGFARYAELAAERPRDPQVRRDWARRLAQAGRPGEAAERLAEARMHARGDAWVAFEHGMALERAGRGEAAIEAFRAAAQLDGRLHCAFEEWGRTLEGLGRIEAGRRRLERAARLRGEQAHCPWP